MKFGIRGHLTDVIMCVKFLVDRFRGYGVLIPPKLPFPIDLRRRPYNSVALPCDTVMERLHTYMYGRRLRVTVETDHKPLLMIIKKPLMSASKRLQRMLLRLQSYNFELVEEEQKAELRLIASEATIKFLHNAAGEDESHQLLKLQIRNGWPILASQIPEELREFFTIADELSVYGDLVYKGPSVVVPVGAREHILERIHSSHIGINGCLRRAREVVFWPGMTSQIKDRVQRCGVCQEFQAANQCEPLQSQNIPGRPWEKVAVDLFTLKDQIYVITVDYFSNFFEVDNLPSKKISDITYCLKSQFARHGIPEIVFSDNLPFSSQKFAKFTARHEFRHDTSSSRYPQSSGKAEIAERLLTKAMESNADLFLALLDWRNTPSESLKQSPAQILFGRHTRTRLPSTQQQLCTPTSQDIQRHLAKAKEKQAKYYDRGTMPRPSLKVGDTVCFLS